MDRLDAMAVFVTIIDAGSLAAAARKLGRSPASVTRAVSLLEDRLGERLLHRSTRNLRLTESGERQAAVYRSVLAELAEIEGGPSTGDRLEGRITLTAPELFGRLKVMPVVEGFLAEHAEVRARVLLLNRVVNLVEEGVDVAVRLAWLPNSGLVAVRLGEMRQLLCAAPDYVERRGEPETPDDLRTHLCIGGQDGHEREVWHFTDRSKSRHRVVSVAVHPRIAVNGAAAAVDAALRGSGLCRAMAYQVEEHLEAGRLIPLLAAFEPAPVPVHLVFHPVPRRNAALRAFLDHATPRLRAALAASGSGTTG